MLDLRCDNVSLRLFSRLRGKPLLLLQIRRHSLDREVVRLRGTGSENNLLLPDRVDGGGDLLAGSLHGLLRVPAVGVGSREEGRFNYFVWVTKDYIILFPTEQRIWTSGQLYDLDELLLPLY